VRAGVGFHLSSEDLNFLKVIISINAGEGERNKHRDMRSQLELLNTFDGKLCLFSE
jgi:hypothetical protein